MRDFFGPVGPVGINWGAFSPATGDRRPNRMARMELPNVEEVTATRETADAGRRECPAHSAG